MTDANICTSCPWEEYGDEVNPNRQQCPNCGAKFGYREEVRFFDRVPNTTDTEVNSGHESR